MSLSQFIKTHCERHPGLRVPVADFCDAFKAALPYREHWTRGEIIAGLRAAGFPVAVDPATRIYYVGRLSLRGSWIERGGKLELQRA